MINEKDLKLFENLLNDAVKLYNFLCQYSYEEVKGNKVLQKAIGFEIIHLVRDYKKLGGRFAAEFGQMHEILKDYGSAIEGDIHSADLLDLASKAKNDLPNLIKLLKSTMQK